MKPCVCPELSEQCTTLHQRTLTLAVASPAMLAISEAFCIRLRSCTLMTSSAMTIAMVARRSKLVAPFHSEGRYLFAPCRKPSIVSDELLIRLLGRAKTPCKLRGRHMVRVERRPPSKAEDSDSGILKDLRTTIYAPPSKLRHSSMHHVGRTSTYHWLNATLTSLICAMMEKNWRPRADAWPSASVATSALCSSRLSLLQDQYDFQQDSQD